MERASTASPGSSRLPIGALRHRDFRLLWIGSVISNIGTWMHIVAQGWLMYQLTDSPLYLGLVGLMRAVPLLAFPLVGGVVADRIARLKVLYVTQSAALLLAAFLATATVMGVVQPWHILVFSFLNAAVLAFDNPARQAMLPDLVDRDDLLGAISLNSWAFNGAILFGPALAALLLPLVGIGGVFYLNAASFAAVLIALTLLRTKGGVLVTGSARQNLLDGLRYVTTSPMILTLVLMTAVVSLLGRSYGQLMPVFAKDLLGLDASGMSLLYTVAGLGACVGALLLVLAHNPGQKGRLALGSAVTCAVALGLFALSRSLPLSMVLLFIVGFALIAFSTLVSTLLQTLSPQELRGRVMSVNTIAWQGLEYVGVLITGALATLWGAPGVLLGAAMVIAVVLVGLVMRQRQLLTLPEPDRVV